MERCQNDFWYFCRYLKIADRWSKLVTFEPRPVQQLLYQRLVEHAWLVVLKARKMGSTTFFAAFFFWRGAFHKFEHTLVLGQSQDDINLIFRIYQRYWRYLPWWMKHLLGEAEPTKQSITFGSSESTIRCRTWKSEDRGTDNKYLHLTEAAFYGDMDKVARAAGQTLVHNPMVVYETTANSLNEFYLFWREQGDGYKRLFLNWLHDPEYVGYERFGPERWKRKMKAQLRTKVDEYIRTYKLSKEREAFFVERLMTRCKANLDTWNQEYPITPELAFIGTGAPFFPISWPEVYSDPRTEQLGWIHYDEVGGDTPEQAEENTAASRRWRLYTFGVDTAGGARSTIDLKRDFSACVVLDITDWLNETARDKDPWDHTWREPPVKIAATFRGQLKPREYADSLLEQLEAYTGLAVVEVEGPGAAVQDFLTERRWPHSYVRIMREKMGAQITKQWGFSTNKKTRNRILARCHEFVAKGWIDVQAPRVQLDMNSFVYSDKRSRYEAAPGANDDMVMALAFALEGLTQGRTYERRAREEDKPTTIAEFLRYEQENSIPYDSEDPRWFARTGYRWLDGTQPW